MLSGLTLSLNGHVGCGARASRMAINVNVGRMVTVHCTHASSSSWYLVVSTTLQCSTNQW
jgi:hypothetical protein